MLAALPLARTIAHASSITTDKDNWRMLAVLPLTKTIENAISGTTGKDNWTC